MTSLESVAERIARGASLDAEAAAAILAADDLIAAGMLADGVRRRIHGARTTFGRVFEVHVDAIPAALPAGWDAGEVRIVGRPASLAAACAAVTAVRPLAGPVALTALSLDTIPTDGSSITDALGRLASAGLNGIAETPVDRLAADSASVIGAARTAGLVVDRLTVQEPPADPAALVLAAAELQRTVGGFRVFAPLPRAVPAAASTTGYDDVKLIALARLIVQDVPSIQVDWSLYGPKLAQVALTVGADDVDAVAALDAAGLGPRRTPLEEVQRNIRAAGLEPAERDARFALRSSPADAR